MRNRPRSNLTNAPLERKVPLLALFGLRGLEHVERQGDVRASFPRALACDELADGGRLSPMNIARVLAVAEHFDAEEVLAVAAPDHRFYPQFTAWNRWRKAHGVDGGIDDEITFGR